MKNINKLLIPFLLIQTLMYATDDEIPDGALRLIKKLTAWEEDLEKKFIEERNLKRKQVIVALNSELDRATRKGDLNGALALSSKERVNGQQREVLNLIENLNPLKLM